MRSDYYVYFWTNPYIKLYTLCMADIVMLLILACVDRLARWRVIAWDHAGSASGKRQKTGYSKKKWRAKRVEGWSVRSPFFSPFLPTFLWLKALGTRLSQFEIPGWRFPHLASPLASLLRIFLARKYPGHNNPASYAG